MRHARPLVAPGVCYGALDVPADAAATLLAAQKLAAALPHGVCVWHSPLQRCEQLSQALQALRPDIDPKPDARLREMDFGDWEGRTWDDIGKAHVDTWTADFANCAPGGGESLAQMLGRVQSALDECRRGPPSADVVWITHAGVTRCVAWLNAHGPGTTGLTARDWPLHAPGWGEWSVHPLAPASTQEQ